MKNLNAFFKPFGLAVIVSGCFTAASAQNIIFDNGPIFNSPGTGPGGTDESLLYDITFGMGTYGAGHQVVAGNRVADDFTIGDCRWKIDSVAFFGYQTGSTTTSTFTAVNFAIWDGVPEAPGSNIVFGDTITNRMIRTHFSGTYRGIESAPGNTQRPIMRNVCDAGGVLLLSGTYWIDWQSDGALASGPWATPRTPAGVEITGNAMQVIATGPWQAFSDGGLNLAPQGFPFVLYGSIYNPTADAGNNMLVCDGASPVIGGMPAGTGVGNLAFNWSPSANLSNPAVQNPAYANIAGSNDTLIVSVTDSLNCVATDTVVLQVTSLPTANITASGATTFCQGDGVSLLADTGNGYSYNWSTSQTTDSIFATTGGNVVLIVTDSVGCTDTAQIQLTVNPAPNIAVTQAGASLTSDQSGATWQWLDCGNGNAPIAGETNQNYTATANGNYAVVVTLNGCVDTSVCYTVNGLSTENENSVQASVYPNPAKDVFYIQLTGANDGKYTLQITDVVGKIVSSGIYTFANNSPVSFQTSDWNSGIYLITGTEEKTGNKFQHRVLVP